MSNSRKIWISLTFVALSGLATQSTLSPQLDIDYLVNTSDLVAIGQVVSVQTLAAANTQVGGNEVGGHRARATVQINQTLKGVSNENSTVQFFAPESFVGWRPITTLDYGIFFLKRAADGGLEFTSVYYPFIQVLRDISASGATPLERVISVFSAVLLSSNSSDSQKIMALYSLGASRDPASTVALRGALAASVVELRVRATALLLDRNDITPLPYARDVLLHRTLGGSDEANRNLVYAIAAGVSDEKAVPTLLDLLNSNDTQIRRAAASSLRRTHSQAALQPLTSLLADADLNTRYYAVVGLAEITGQMDWRPNMDDFVSDEEKYLKHWRDWKASQ